MAVEHPGEQHHPNTRSEELLLLKEDLFITWNQLLAEHQASMVLVLLDPVRESEWGLWLREAIEKKWPTKAPAGQPDLEFPEWMKRVDQTVWSIVGCSVYDLLDCDYSSMFDDDAPPE